MYHDKMFIRGSLAPTAQVQPLRTQTMIMDKYLLLKNYRFENNN